MDATPLSNENDLAQKTLDWITDLGIRGIGTIPSAQKVAEDHLCKSGTAEEAINSVMKWRTAHAAGTGFLTGIGGIATAPITIPAGLAASYVLGANLAASIAHIRGYDVNSDQVRTAVLLCLIGGIPQGMLKVAGIKAAEKLSTRFFLHQVPKEALKAINRRVGVTLVTKAGQKGAFRLVKLVPVAGGVVGGALDGAFVNSCGKVAKSIFPPSGKLLTDNDS